MADKFASVRAKYGVDATKKSATAKAEQPKQNKQEAATPAKSTSGFSDIRAKYGLSDKPTNSTPSTSGGVKTTTQAAAEKPAAESKATGLKNGVPTKSATESNFPGKSGKLPEKQTLAKRIANIISGSAKQYASGLTEAPAMAVEGMGGTAVQAMGVYQDQLDTATKRRQYLVDAMQADPEYAKDKSALEQLARYDEEIGRLNKVINANERTGTLARDANLELAQSGARNVEKAKDGLGKTGQFFVDAGVALAQMIGDSAAKAISPGTSLAAMGARVYGNSAQEARQAGASTTQQMLYGAGSAGLEIFSEKLFDGLAGIYGAGAADDVVKQTISKMAKTDNGRKALEVLAGAGEEAAEELVSGVFGPMLNSIYNGKSVGRNLSEMEASDLLRDAAIGGLLGGTMTGAKTAITSIGDATRAKPPVSPTANAGAQIASQGNAVPAAQKSLAEAAQTPVTQAGTDPLISAIRNSQQTQETTPAAVTEASAEQQAAAIPTEESPVMEAPVQTQSGEDLGNTVGAAEAGFGGNFEAMQALSDTFHPINANAEVLTPREQSRTISEVPTENPITEKPISKGASTVLNSPLMTNESAGRFETEAIAQGLADYDRVTDAASIERARQTVEDDGGYQAAATDVINKINSGRAVTKDDFAVFVEAFRDAGNAGDTDTQMIMAEAYTNLSTQTAQLFQSFNLLNYMTPAGRLEVVKRSINRVTTDNNIRQREQTRRDVKRGGKAQKEADRFAEARGVLAQSERTRRAAAENSRAFVPFTFEYSEKAGERLGDVAANMTADKVSRERTFIDTVVSDLAKFAKEKVATSDAPKKTNNRTALDTLTDYVQNESFYGDTWEAAQNYLREKYKNDPAMLSRLDGIINSGIGVNGTVADGDKTMFAAIAQAAAKAEMTPAQIRKAAQGKMADAQAAFAKIGDTLVEKTGATGDVADVLRSAAASYVDGVLAQSERTALNLVEESERRGFVIPEHLQKAYLDPNISDVERNKIVSEMQTAIAKQVKPTIEDKWKAIRYSFMLGNLKTQIRNFAGNTTMLAVSSARYDLAAALGRAVEFASKGKVQTNRAVALPGSKIYNSAWNYYNSGESRVRESLESGQKYNDKAGMVNGFWRGVEDERSVFNLAPAEAARNGITWAMNNRGFGDAAFLRVNFVKAFSGYLKKNGVTAEQLADPKWRAQNKTLLQLAEDFAIPEAEEATFHDHNAISDYVSKIGRGEGTPWFAKVIGEGIMPFRSTPANVFMRILEYSPLEAIKSTVDTVRAVKGSDTITADDVINEWAKTMTGSALFIAGVMLRKAGILRGKGDDDDEQQYFSELQGQQEYSVEVDGTSHTISWLAPTSVPLLLGANFVDMLDTENLTIGDASKLLLSVTDPIIQTSMLSSVDEAISTAADVDDGGSAAALFTNALTSYFTQGLLPSGYRQLETAFGFNKKTGKLETRDYSRYTYIDPDSQLSKGQQKAIGKISRAVPFWDFQQIPFTDAWGRTESGDGVVGAFVNPAYSNDLVTTDVDVELQRLVDANKAKTSIFPERAPKTIDLYAKTTKDGKTTYEKLSASKKLSADEYDKFSRIWGKNQFNVQNALISSKDYDTLTDDQKVDAINAAYSYAHSKSRTEFEKNAKPVDLQTKIDDSGLAPEKYIIDSIKYGDDYLSKDGQQALKAVEQYGLDMEDLISMNADGGPSLSQEEAATWIRAHGYDTNTGTIIYNAVAKRWGDDGVWKTSYTDKLAAIDKKAKKAKK